jgi:tyrosinase
MSRTTRLVLAALAVGSSVLVGGAPVALAQHPAAPKVPNLENPLAQIDLGAPPIVGGGRDVSGDSGRDRVSGGPGDDVIRTGRGDDRVRGAAGDDAIFGGSGDDLLDGGPGGDMIVDTSGRDRVLGGTGEDRIDVRDGRSGDRVACGEGPDLVVADRGDDVAADCETVLNGSEQLVRRDAKDLSADEKRRFVDAILRLKATPSPYDTRINWYDQFVVWHDLAFADAAHGSPAFLPWHREFLKLFEGALQTASGEPIALPYWDWTDPASTAAVFAEDMLGGNGDRRSAHAVTSGPFRRGAWRVWVRDPRGVQPLNPAAGSVPLEPTFLQRAMGSLRGVRLPTSADVGLLLGVSPYDARPWDGSARASKSFRNGLEGWTSLRAGMGNHNSVHVWVGGDDGTMGKTTSPNDPVFWLHHNNVDRLWEAWSRRFGRAYLPSSGARRGANLRDPLSPFSGVGIRAIPAGLLRTEPLGYVYEALPGAAEIPSALAASVAVASGAAANRAAARAGLLCVLPPDDERG